MQIKHLTPEQFEQALRKRGFVNIEKYCDKGQCNLNEKHYILVTDGLYIYSTHPQWDSDAQLETDIVKEWYWDEFDENSLKELDNLLNKESERSEL